jgi:hypothetical protein
MAKIKYDVRDVEPSRSFDKPIPVGVYRMSIANALKRKSNSGNDMLEIEMEVLKGEHKGRKVWEYIVLDESSEWKVRQLIDALGEKLKGTLDTDKLIGKTLTIKTKHDSFERDNEEGETEIVVTSKVASLLPLKKAGEDAEAEEETEPEEETEAEAEEETEGEYTWDDLQEMDRKELKAFIKENESDHKVKKGESDDAIRDALAEEFGIEKGEDAEAEEETEPEEETEAEAEEETEGEYTWDDLQEMDRKELKAFIKENESDHKVKKGESDDAIRDALAEEFGIEKGEDAEAEEETEPEEETEGADYNEWTMPDLKKELKSRDLKTSGTKKALVKRLEKDDAGGSKSKEEPF